MDRTDRSESLEIALWRRMVVRACRAGIRIEDAQDLAGRAILQAIESFDAARGAFTPFCLTIHANLTRNHFRDRKITVEFDPDRDDRTAPDNPLELFEDEETRTMMRDLADRILAELDSEEAAFFLTLGDVMAAMETGAVSEAARRSGLSPAKGWDIFRRIRRKARKHARLFEELGEPYEAESIEEAVCAAPAPEAPAAAPAGRAVPGEILFLSAGAAVAGFDRFAAGLSRAQRERLATYIR